MEKLTVKGIFDKLIANGVWLSNMRTGINKLPKREREYALENTEKIKKLFVKHNIKVDNKNRLIEARKKSALFKSVGIKNNKETRRILQLIAEEARTSHSMGCEVDVFVNDKRVYTYDSRQEYSNSCSYKAKHGWTKVFLTGREVNSMKYIGHVLTTSIRKTKNPKVYSCKVLTFTGKYDVTMKWKKMFLTKDFHAESIERAVEWRKQQAETLWNRREALRESFKRMRLHEEELNSVRNVFVGFHHSIKAGNCKVGTEMFAKRHNLNIDHGYTLGYLRELSPNNDFIKRISEYIIKF